MKQFQLRLLTLISLTIAGCTYTESGSMDVKIDLPKTGETKTTSSETTNSSTWTSSTGSENEIVNGIKTLNGKGTRYSRRINNGVETKLETSNEVVFRKGKPVKWPANAVISLSETRIGTTKLGELRPDGSEMKIWMKHGDSFKPGTADDQKWADSILAAANLDDTPEPEKKKETVKYKIDDPQFAKKLSSLHYSKDIAEVMTEKAKAPSLTAKEQIALIDLVFQKVHYDTDRKEILLQLTHRKDLSKEAKTHLIDNMDKIHYEADKKLIQKELLNAK